MKKVLVDMSATLIHHGHIRLLKKASEIGEVIVGLTSDEEIKLKKGYVPELNFNQRKEILLSIKYVKEVIKTKWLITEEILNENLIDFLVHGNDNSNLVEDNKIILFNRTEGISSSELRYRAHKALIDKSNQKLMLTPGPSAISYESVKSFIPIFGRGDDEYNKIQQKVSEWLNLISGQDQTISLIGSATCAIEICIANFIKGKILAINNGYYSERLSNIAKQYYDIDILNIEDLETVKDQYDWIMGCYTETSTGYLLNIDALKKLKEKTNAKLFLDATGSIGLEENHNIADIIAYSSCKGLFGLTGASFISKKSSLKPSHEVESKLPFYLRYSTHAEKKITGPYHIINGLNEISKSHHLLVKNIRNFRKSFINTYSENLVWEEKNQPLLCTKINLNIKKKNPNSVLYEPRILSNGNIICHLHAIDGKSIDRLNNYIDFI